jgi:hypothetical protein
VERLAAQLLVERCDGLPMADEQGGPKMPTAASCPMRELGLRLALDERQERCERNGEDDEAPCDVQLERP